MSIYVMLGLFIFIMLLILNVEQNCFACTDESTDISYLNENYKSYIKIFYNEVFSADVVKIEQLHGESPAKVNLKDFVFFGGIAIGYNKNNVIAEFELINSRVKLKDEISSVYTGMTNIYYEYHIESIAFSPYFGAGMGFGIIPTLKTQLIPLDIPILLPVLSYQGKLGINYKLASEVKIAVDYRYFHAFAILGKVAQHNVGIEISYIF